MPTTVVIPAYLQPFAGNQDRIELVAGAKTVADVMRLLGERYPGARDRVLTERGEIREHINIFVGDKNVRFESGLATPVPDGAEVMILTAVSGG